MTIRCGEKMSGLKACCVLPWPDIRKKPATMSTHAIMMMQSPGLLKMLFCGFLLVMFDVVFILTDVFLINNFSVALLSQCERLMHGLQPLVT